MNEVYIVLVKEAEMMTIVYSLQAEINEIYCVG